MKAKILSDDFNRIVDATKRFTDNVSSGRGRAYKYIRFDFIVAPLCERRLTVSGLTAMAALRAALLVEMKLTIAAGRRTSAISCASIKAGTAPIAARS